METRTRPYDRSTPLKTEVDALSRWMMRGQIGRTEPGPMHAEVAGVARRCLDPRQLRVAGRAHDQDAVRGEVLHLRDDALRTVGDPRLDEPVRVVPDELAEGLQVGIVGSAESRYTWQTEAGSPSTGRSGAGQGRCLARFGRRRADHPGHREEARAVDALDPDAIAQPQAGSGGVGQPPRVHARGWHRRAGAGRAGSVPVRGLNHRRAEPHGAVEVPKQGADALHRHAARRVPGGPDGPAVPLTATVHGQWDEEDDRRDRPGQRGHRHPPPDRPTAACRAGEPGDVRVRRRGLGVAPPSARAGQRGIRGVAHSDTSNIGRSRARASANVDLTVPSAQPMTVAVSATDRPTKYTHSTARR
jgi:hypothetical protein